MASGDFELTIVISAIDDASAVLQTVASEIVQDFNLISEQAKAAEADIDSVLGVFSSFDSSLVALQADIDGVLGVFGSFDSSLVVLQQDALATLQGLDQPASVMGSATDLSGSGDSGSLSGFDFLSDGTNPLYGDLSGLSNEQSDLTDQMVGATQASPSSLQLIQNNTFNGILDPSAIQDQIIPELERAVTRGVTLLATA